MAQKKRGLGRGLEALIPEAQVVNPSRRPSDIFFPESSHAAAGSRATSTQERGASEPEGSGPGAGTGTPHRRQSEEIASALLAPSKRSRRAGARRKKSTDADGTTGDVSRETGSVSRETGSAVAEGAKAHPGTTEDAAVPGTTAAPITAPDSAAGMAARATRSRATVEPAESRVPPTPSATQHTSEATEPAETATGAEPEPTATATGAEPEPTATATGVETLESGDSMSEPPTSPEYAAAARTDAAPVASTDAVADASAESADEPRRAPSGEGTGATLTAAEPELVPVPGASFGELSIDSVSPNPQQPRQVFDEDDISELAASIREVGLLQPIVVRRVSGDESEQPSYELVMGERRLRAAKEAGLTTIPAVIRDTTDEDLLRDALLENLHRVQLNPLEEAAAYQQLLDDFHCTHAELSERVARSRSQISNTLRLLKLPPLVQRRLAAGVLSAGHARALLGLPDGAAMERLAQRVVSEGLSVRATEELVAVHDEARDTPVARSAQPRSTPLPALSTRLSDAFDTRVKVTRGAKKGRITIEFAGDDDLERLVEALAPGTRVSED